MMKLKKSSRKLNDLDSSNKILTKDLDMFKTKAKDIEEEILSLKESIEREKKETKECIKIKI